LISAALVTVILATGVAAKPRKEPDSKDFIYIGLTNAK
jgi:hypothetical protein